MNRYEVFVRYKEGFCIDTENYSGDKVEVKWLKPYRGYSLHVDGISYIGIGLLKHIVVFDRSCINRKKHE